MRDDGLDNIPFFLFNMVINPEETYYLSIETGKAFVQRQPNQTIKTADVLLKTQNPVCFLSTKARD